jgi:hypothetical protein
MLGKEVYTKKEKSPSFKKLYALFIYKNIKKLSIMEQFQETKIDNILEAADYEGLKVCETTEGMNGYPKNIKKCIIGFDTFKDVEDFVEKYGGTISGFKKRDGHHFYKNEGSVFRPYSVEDFIQLYGDNGRIIYDVDEEIIAVKESGNDEQFIEDEIWSLETLKEELTDDTVIVQLDGRNEIMNKECISFSEDVYSYVIGVDPY